MLNFEKYYFVTDDSDRISDGTFYINDERNVVVVDDDFIGCTVSEFFSRSDVNDNIILYKPYIDPRNLKIVNYVHNSSFAFELMDEIGFNDVEDTDEDIINDNIDFVFEKKYKKTIRGYINEFFKIIDVFAEVEMTNEVIDFLEDNQMFTYFLYDNDFLEENVKKTVTVDFYDEGDFEIFNEKMSNTIFKNKVEIIENEDEE